MKYVNSKFLNGEVPDRITKEQEQILLDRMAEGKNPSAREKLINHNLWLVETIVSSIKLNDSKFGNDISEELLSVACIGLIKAVDSFNPNFGVLLTSYADKCIRHDIAKYFERYVNCSRASSFEELFDADQNLDGTESLRDTDEPFTETIEDKMIVEKVTGKLNKLTELEKRLFDLRFKKFLTQQKIAEALNINQVAVSRAEKKLIFKLQKFANEPEKKQTTSVLTRF